MVRPVILAPLANSQVADRPKNRAALLVQKKSILSNPLLADYDAYQAANPMNPEEKARREMDAMLKASGWDVQSKGAVNLSAARGVAICELSFATGEPDSTLFIDAKALGTVEAKPEGHSLTGVEEQSTKYVTGVPHGLPHGHVPLPFCYESTGAEAFFTNRLDPDPRSVRSQFSGS
jgi:type I site-specific restriction endonuclease